MADLAVWQRTIVDEEGNVIPGAEIEVRREEDDSLATLYADRAGETPLANPLAADMSGFVRFFAQGDAYTITAVGAGSTRTWRFDPTGRLQEFDRVSEALNAAGGADTLETRKQLGTFSSVAEVQSHHIPPVLDSIRTNGYYDPGDAGGALYKRVASEPSHAGKIQSADGNWWEYAEDEYFAKAFGVRADGITDDTDALQSAIDAAIPSRGVVRVPKGVCRITKPLTTHGGVQIEGWVGTSGNPNAGSVLYQEDPTRPLFELKGRPTLNELNIYVNNTDVYNPVQGPPSIAILNQWPTITNIRFQYAFIGIGNLPGGEEGAAFIQKITGFVHHRMVYLEGTKGISYIDTVHARPPNDANPLNETTWAGKHRVLVESHDADGIFGVNWFIWGGRGLYKHSGAGLGSNLMTTVANAGAEFITHGIEIEAGSVQAHAVSFNGLYLQTSHRADGEYLVSCDSDIKLLLSGFVANFGPGTDYVVVKNGDVTITGSRMNGFANATCLRKFPGGRLSVSDTVFDRVGTLLHMEEGAENVYFDASNKVYLLDNPGASPVFVNDESRLSGNNHVFIPAHFLNENGETTRRITEYHPAKNRMMYTAGGLWVHRNAERSDEEGAYLMLSEANNAGHHRPGARVRVSAHTTGANTGSESAELWLEHYYLGEWAPPLRLRNTDLHPGSDNVRSLGVGNARYTELYAAAGTINTSDAREKTPLRQLTENEQAVAIRLSKLPGVYQWLSAIDSKGEAGARLHVGVIAQDVKAAFEAESLDGFRYGVLCWDEWGDEAESGMLAGDRYGIRYDELAQWQAAGWDARLAVLEGDGD